MIRIDLHVAASVLFIAIALQAPANSNASEHSAAAAEIRIWGSPAERELLHALEQAYRAVHPDVRFSYRLHGPESTLAGVYTGVADLAFMSREMREPLERMAFEWALLSKPFEVEFAHRGFAQDAPGAQLGVFVNAASPVASLSLSQLDAILGTERRRGGPPMSDWSALETGGARGTINIYGPVLDSVASLFIRHVVLLDSHKWNPAYPECADRRTALDALATDPAGIAIASIGDLPPGVRLLALSRDAAAAAVLPSTATVQDRSYPLSRSLTVVAYRPAGDPLRPELHAYLRFLLSPAGQAIIGRDASFLPLSRAAAYRQLARLD